MLQLQHHFNHLQVCSTATGAFSDVCGPCCASCKSFACKWKPENKAAKTHENKGQRNSTNFGVTRGHLKWLALQVCSCSPCVRMYYKVFGFRQPYHQLNSLGKSPGFWPKPLYTIYFARPSESQSGLERRPSEGPASRELQCKWATDGSAGAWSANLGGKQTTDMVHAGGEEGQVSAQDPQLRSRRPPRRSGN